MSTHREDEEDVDTPTCFFQIKRLLICQRRRTVKKTDELFLIVLPIKNRNLIILTKTFNNAIMIINSFYNDLTALINIKSKIQPH